MIDMADLESIKDYLRLLQERWLREARRARNKFPKLSKVEKRNIRRNKKARMKEHD